MYDFCRQWGPCGLVPPEWHWLMAIAMPLLFLVLLGVPIANILHRAGRSRWWIILAFVPFVNLICLWVFAFTRWPAVDR
jgi:hypothetical protein